MIRSALLSEALGSLILFATVIGSGIMAERLAGGNVAVALLVITIATGAILFVLITMFAPLSGARFNPAVTLVMQLRGHVSTRVAIGYAVAQLLGGILGVWLAHLMFDVPVLQLSTSFANPAITIARSLSDSFAGIAPWCMPGFVTAQILGALAAHFVAKIPFTEKQKVTA